MLTLLTVCTHEWQHTLLASQSLSGWGVLYWKSPPCTRHGVYDIIIIIIIIIETVTAPGMAGKIEAKAYE